MPTSARRVRTAAAGSTAATGIAGKRTCKTLLAAGVVFANPLLLALFAQPLLMILL
jgi:hypothetical protein